MCAFPTQTGTDSQASLSLQTAGGSAVLVLIRARKSAREQHTPRMSVADAKSRQWQPRAEKLELFCVWVEGLTSSNPKTLRRRGTRA